MAKRRTSFLGTGWSFPPSFDRKYGIVEMVKDEADIQESIRIIIETNPGERMMYPKFGCGIRKFVFETISPTSISMMRDIIYDAILFHEPRVKIIDIRISSEPPEYWTSHSEDKGDSVLFIHIVYKIIITNTRHNMVYPFYIKEGTNL